MSNWRLFKHEERGAVEDKKWVMNEGGELALFKPYDEFKNPIGAELNSYKVALALGIPCARIEEVTISGVDGIVSYDFREDGFTYCPGGGLIEKAVGFTLVRENSDGDIISPHGEPCGNITVQDIQTNKRLKPLEKGVIDMLFFDCLILNQDRHGKNWEIKLDIKGEIAGIAPLFDHGYCLNDDNVHKVRFPWRKDRNRYVYLSFENFFGKLCEQYPSQIHDWLKKCDEIKNTLPEFCRNRLRNMNNVYTLLVEKESRDVPVQPTQPRRRR